jgi:hypothetical protein
VRKSLAWVALVWWTVACGSATGQTIHSGITGRVVAGPTCPVERVPPDPGCAPRPISARIRIRSVSATSGGHVVRSGSDGRFAIRLPAGTYVVKPLPQGSEFPRPGPKQTVVVHVGHYTHITITYDTGIR